VSCLGYSTKALVQVQRKAQAKCTDCQLGYLFVQASQTGNDNDMLNDGVLVSEDKSEVAWQQPIKSSGKIESS